MFEEEVSVVEQIVEKLSNAAKLKAVPEIEISKAQRIARAHFFNPKITIGEAVLRRWKDGEMNTDDIEILLAHEIGHLVDFQNGLTSVSAKSATKTVLYSLAVIGLIAVLITSVISTGIIGLMSLFGFLILLYLFPYEVRKWALRVQLEADRNASKLIEKRRFGLGIVRQIRLPVPNGVTEAWTLLQDVLVWSRISERLRNLDLEPEDIQVRFREQPSKA